MHISNQIHQNRAAREYGDLMHRIGEYELKAEKVNGSTRYNMDLDNRRIFCSISNPLQDDDAPSSPKKLKMDAEAREAAPRVTRAYLSGFTDSDLESFIKGSRQSPRHSITHLNLTNYFTDFSDAPTWLKPFLNLTSIDLSNSTITDDAFAKVLESCPNLTHIDLSGCQAITDKALESISSFSPNLVSINLSYCSKITPKGLAALTGNCKQLSSISLRQLRIIRNCVVKSCVLASPNLTSINLNECTLITNGVLHVFSRYCPNLLSLNIAYCSNITDEGVSLLAQRCHKLKSVDVEACPRLTERSVRSLIENCPDLTSLNLMWSPIPREAFPQFNLRNFTHLNLGCCNINDFIVVNLAKENPNLASLFLTGCFEITDIAIKAFAQHCRHLEKIDLQLCNITDVSLRTLSAYCLYLNSITCTDCWRVTEQAVLDIKQRYPQITLISDF